MADRSSGCVPAPLTVWVSRPPIRFPVSYGMEHLLHLLHKRIQAAGLDCGDARLHLETVARAIGLLERHGTRAGAT